MGPQRTSLNAAPKNALGLKSILGTENLTPAQIKAVLDCAFFFKENAKAGTPLKVTLAGKTIILLFFEPSTRTRGSFELAAKRLKADTLVLTKEMSSSEKGETQVRVLGSKKSKM